MTALPVTPAPPVRTAPPRAPPPPPPKAFPGLPALLIVFCWAPPAPPSGEPPAPGEPPEALPPAPADPAPPPPAPPWPLDTPGAPLPPPNAIVLLLATAPAPAAPLLFEHVPGVPEWARTVTESPTIDESPGLPPEAATVPAPPAPPGGRVMTNPPVMASAGSSEYPAPPAPPPVLELVAVAPPPPDDDAQSCALAVPTSPLGAGWVVLLVNVWTTVSSANLATAAHLPSGAGQGGGYSAVLRMARAAHVELKPDGEI